MELQGKVCAACGTARKVRNLRYDPNTLLGYCENPYICNSAHPNSPTNIHVRALKGGNAEAFLVTLDDAEKLYREKLLIENPDSEAVKIIRRILEKPVSVRITSPDQAKFVAELMDEFNFNNVSEAIRYCVQMLKDSKGAYYTDHKKIEQEHQEEVQAEQFKKELEQSVNEAEPTPIEDKKQDEEDTELSF